LGGSRVAELTQPVAGPQSTMVKSARRIMEIFELFDRLQRDLSLSEVSRELGYPPSSTSALLHSLVELGYLSVDQFNRTYRPTPRVTLLGSWINAAYFRDGALHRLMKDLNDRTGETIILAVQTELIARYIHVVQGTNPMCLYVQHGAIRPLATSGVGRLFLSRYDLDQQRKIVTRLNANRQPDEPYIDFSEISEDVKRIRKRGYVVSADRVTPGAGVVARFLPSHAEERPIAIGIGGLSDVILACQAEFADQLRIGINLHLASIPQLMAQETAQKS
jgi:IclR family acetate operon transcriptional repressor